MVRLTLRGFVLAVACGICAEPVSAGWVWSPQTGWVGPTGAVKDTPREQLEHAFKLFERRDYDKARIEFQKLLRHYKDSPEAPDAQYYVGRCYEEEGTSYEAFLAYRKTIEVYPSTKRFDEILAREYEIGNDFLSGRKRKLFGTAAVLPARDKAIEIFHAIVEDGPFSEYGPLAQYKLGMAHMAFGEYEQAVSAFEQLVDRYPDSPLVDDARFQSAQASLRGTFRSAYDQAPTDQAMEELTAFIGAHPDSDLTPEAQARMSKLLEQRAAHEFQIAQFYERQKQYASALLYYRSVVRDYAKTSLGPKAAARIEVLERIVP